jgi:hypothetical protein
MKEIWALAIVGVLLAGCATPAQKAPAERSPAKVETRADVKSALESVTKAVSGQQVTEAEMRNLSRQIEQDAGTRRAVETVTDAVSGAPVQVKYCPIDGKRFSAGLKTCPEHSVELKVVE